MNRHHECSCFDLQPCLCVFRVQSIREADIKGGGAGALQDPQRRHGEECVWGRQHQHPHLPQQGNVFLTDPL